MTSFSSGRPLPSDSAAGVIGGCFAAFSLFCRLLSHYYLAILILHRAKEYGLVYTVKVLGLGTWIIICDPDLMQRIYVSYVSLHVGASACASVDMIHF